MQLFRFLLYTTLLKNKFHSVPDDVIYIQMSRAAEATGTLTTQCLKSHELSTESGL